MSQQRPDPDDEQRRREEIQAQQAGAQYAAQSASQAFDQLERPEFLDKLADPEVDSEFFETASGLLGPELSRIHMIANETEEDHHRHRWLNENRADQIIAEHNPGRLCKGPVAAVAQGTHNTESPMMSEFTEHEKRMIWEALSVKTGMQSLAKGNRGLKSITEATAVSRVEHGDDGGDDSGGRKYFKKVFG